MKDNNKMNYTNSRHPEGTRAQALRREPYPFNASVKNPKDLQTQSHVITRSNIEQKWQRSIQSDVVIHNKLGNGKTCLGLLRRFVYKITNIKEISPRNDMNNKNGKELINLSTYPLIDFKKVAFTLAETLITLGIIGIVAAMTIPTLITNYQKESTVTRLKKAIAVINQAYKQSFDDVGEPDSAFDMEAEEYFKQYWAPYIKVLTYCSNPQVCGYDSNNPFITPKKTSANTTLVSQSWRTTFYTMDGFLYIVMTAGGNPKGPSFDVLVDINGGAKPNRFGRDVFKLVRVPDGGGVQPFGYDRTNDVVESSCADNGWTCAEKIRRAGWRIEKDYPWK